jgi:hypothetical protein
MPVTNSIGWNKCHPNKEPHHMGEGEEISLDPPGSRHHDSHTKLPPRLIWTSPNWRDFAIDMQVNDGGIYMIMLIIVTGCM